MRRYYIVTYCNDPYAGYDTMAVFESLKRVKEYIIRRSLTGLDIRDFYVDIYSGDRHIASLDYKELNLGGN